MTDVRWFHEGNGNRCSHSGRPCVEVVFSDGSNLGIAWYETDSDRRQCYLYAVDPSDPDDPIIVIGRDLRSGVGEPVDVGKALAAWVSFASADADTYRSSMTGDPFQEWAYLNDDELSALALDLVDEDHGDGDDTAGGDRHVQD